MRLSCLSSAGVEGVDGYPVTVEVSRSEPASGPGRIHVVGLPDAAVREAVDRVTTAIFASDLHHNPGDLLVVNLAPGDRRKEGPAFELAIALGALATIDRNRLQLPEDCLFVAELALDGSLRPVRGVLAAAQAARSQGLKRLMVAPDNAAEASLVPGLSVHAPSNLREAVAWLRQGLDQAPRCQPPAEDPGAPISDLDLADVRGQDQAKRALVIAAAGGHNLLFIGPPGSGKTMLAKRLPGILPPLGDDEALEVTRIHSVAGLYDGRRGLYRQRPFRSPHHSVSAVGLVGGGAVPRPGEVSLAHHGVLFLDELPEFPRRVLEHLRQPLEDGELTISRAAGRLRFPARCMLVAAMNPCPCGYLGHPVRACVDSREAIHRYRAHISGPLLDRIDCHLEVAAQPVEQMTRANPGPSSAELRLQVLATRERMFARQGCANGQLVGRALLRHAAPEPDAQALLHQAIGELGLSNRAHDRILRVARTIADLEGAAQAAIEHISEAIGYRLLDRSSW
ncbi:MAG: ATP-binding protein [Planctomycetota bacterium]|nr:MAG: ATP-binding protein [Planctomycetota bacterium]